MGLLGPLYGGGFWVALRQLAAVRAACCRRRRAAAAKPCLCLLPSASFADLQPGNQAAL
jgi:hypothetical protein